MDWLAGHWFELLQTVSILIGFFVTVHSVKEDTKERKTQNLLSLTAAHREIWSKLYDKPELIRILLGDVDLDTTPPTLDEALIVHLAILHLNASFKARKNGMEFDDDGVKKDIRSFFEHPIPRMVWKSSKEFQSPDFVEFVESNFVSNAEQGVD